MVTWGLPGVILRYLPSVNLELFLSPRLLRNNTFILSLLHSWVPFVRKGKVEELDCILLSPLKIIGGSRSLRPHPHCSPCVLQRLQL
jgi:hypothetical protein